MNVVARIIFFLFCIVVAWGDKSIAAVDFVDHSFAENGVAMFKFGKNSEVGRAELCKDGSILIGGVVDDDVALLKCSSSGKLDPTFGVKGVVSSDMGGKDVVFALATYADGTIVVGVSTTPPGEYIRRINLIRFDEKGVFDDTYGEKGHVSIDLGNMTKINALVPLDDGRTLVAGMAGADHRAVLALYNKQGSLDTSFGNGGIVRDKRTNSEYTSLSLQENGKIVACGLVRDSQYRSNALAVRYTSEGHEDPSFGNLGLLEVNLGSSVDRFNKAVVLEDGAILFAGESAPDHKRVVVAFKVVPSGAPDKTFGDDGKKIITLEGLEAFVTDIVVLPDSSLLIAGHGGNSKRAEKYDFMLARCHKDGVVYKDFGDEGFLLDHIGADDKVCSIKVASDGGVLLIGNSGKYGWSSNKLSMVVKKYSIKADPNEPLKKDPALDGSFGEQGLTYTDFFGDDKPNDMIVFPDKSSLLVGSAFQKNTGASQVVMAKYTASGQLDPSFGVQGKEVLLAGNQAYGYKAIPLSDGRYYVGGAVDDQLSLFRFEEDGSLDSSFGTKGISIIHTPFKCWGRAMAVQSDGKILLGGRMEKGPFDHRVVVCRCDESGNLDPSFGNGGIISTDVSHQRMDIYAMSIQPDGSIVVAGDGSTKNDSDNDIFMARYKEDGTLDSSFGEDGILLLDAGAREYIRGLAILDNGSIIIAGAGGPEGRMMIACLDKTGKLETSFGDGGQKFFDLHNPEKNGRYFGRALSLFPDGRIFLTGDFNGKIVTLCATLSGDLDTTFGKNGSIHTDLGGWSGGMVASVVEPGDLLVGGFHRHDFFLAKYTGPASFRLPSVQEARGGKVSLVSPFKKITSPLFVGNLKKAMQNKGFSLNGELECVQADISFRFDSGSEEIRIPFFPSQFQSKKGMSLGAFLVAKGKDDAIYQAFKEDSILLQKAKAGSAFLGYQKAEEETWQLVIVQGIFSVKEEPHNPVEPPSPPSPPKDDEDPEEPTDDPEDPVKPPVSPDIKTISSSGGGCMIGGCPLALLFLVPLAFLRRP